MSSTWWGSRGAWYPHAVELMDKNGGDARVMLQAIHSVRYGDDLGAVRELWAPRDL